MLVLVPVHGTFCGTLQPWGTLNPAAVCAGCRKGTSRTWVGLLGLLPLEEVCDVTARNRAHQDET